MEIDNTLSFMKPWVGISNDEVRCLMKHVMDVQAQQSVTNIHPANGSFPGAFRRYAGSNMIANDVDPRGR